MILIFTIPAWVGLLIFLILYASADTIMSIFNIICWIGVFLCVFMFFAAIFELINRDEAYLEVGECLITIFVTGFIIFAACSIVIKNHQNEKEKEARRTTESSYDSLYFIDDTYEIKYSFLLSTANTNAIVYEKGSARTNSDVESIIKICG